MLMQSRAIAPTGTTRSSMPDLSWFYTHLAILLLECPMCKANCNAFRRRCGDAHLHASCFLLLCPLASTPPPLEHQAFLTQVSSSHSCSLTACSTGAACPEIRRQWIALPAVRGSQAALSSPRRTQPHCLPPPPGSGEVGGSTSSHTSSGLARPGCTIRLYTLAHNVPALLASPRTLTHSTRALSLVPSRASDANVLSSPALIDNENGLIKKAVDRVNHSLLQD